MYNSSYDGNGRIAKVSPVNSIIVVINLAVFAWLYFTGNPDSIEYMYNHGANFWQSVFEDGEYYRLLTCAFIHFSWGHVFNNMLVLAYVGDNLERALGKVKYIVFYLVTAIGASIVSDIWAMLQDSHSISGGASGAVFGVVGAMLVIVIRHRGRLEDLSSRRLGLFIIFTIYYGVSSVGIDNAAHIGGAIIGALMVFILYRPKKKKDTEYTQYMQW